MVRALRFVVVALVVSLAGCSLLYTFDRLADVVEGSVSGVAVRRDEDGQPPAPFAQVVTTGLPRSVRADADGQFVVRGLVAGPWVMQVIDDEDGDGWPERTRAVGAVLRTAAHQNGYLGETERTTSVLLDAVELDGPYRIDGVVRVIPPGGDTPVAPASAGFHARVVVVAASQALDFAQGAAPVDVTLGALAAVGADGAGAFRFDAVGSGEAKVVVQIREESGDPANPGPIVAASRPIAVSGTAGDEIVVEGTIDVDLRTPQGFADTQVLVIPTPTADVYFLVTAPGRAQLPCALGAAPTPGFQPPPFTHVYATPTRGAAADVATTLPVGHADVRVCSGEQQGDLFNQVVSANGVDDGPVLLGPALLYAIGEDPCVVDTTLDCDDDGREGLPRLLPGSPSFDDDVARYAACVADCQDAVGSAALDRTCAIGSDEYDCDDDGDGQPDVTEDPACLGPGRGTDLDGDALCSGTDPFPQCAANAADACVAGTNDVALAVPPLFGGEVLTSTCPPLFFDGALGPTDLCRANGDPGDPVCARFSLWCNEQTIAELYPRLCPVGDECVTTGDATLTCHVDETDTNVCVANEGIACVNDDECTPGFTCRLVPALGRNACTGTPDATFSYAANCSCLDAATGGDLVFDLAVEMPGPSCDGDAKNLLWAQCEAFLDAQLLIELDAGTPDGGLQEVGLDGGAT